MNKLIRTFHDIINWPVFSAGTFPTENIPAMPEPKDYSIEQQLQFVKGAREVFEGDPSNHIILTADTAYMFKSIEETIKRVNLHEQGC